MMELDGKKGRRIDVLNTVFMSVISFVNLWCFGS